MMKVFIFLWEAKPFDHKYFSANGYFYFYERPWPTCVSSRPWRDVNNSHDFINLSWIHVIIL